MHTAVKDSIFQDPPQIGDTETHRINFLWLLRLRWGAVAGQVITIFVAAWFIKVELPLAALAVTLAVEMATNCFATLWVRRAVFVRQSAMMVLLALDVVLLTLLLYLTGGPYNPFSFLYLVHIALAAVVLQASHTWGLAALSFGCFGLLFVKSSWLKVEGHAGGHGQHLQMHLLGMWIAFGVAAAFIAYFISRVRRSLAIREAELMQTRLLASRSERLASLATLAAGAAHELRTPLATIAVVAKELERELTRMHSSSQAVADALLIRREVDRCHAILQHLATSAGQTTGEGFAHVQLSKLIAVALQGLGDAPQVNVVTDAETSTLYLPLQTAASALRSLIKNATEASPQHAKVTVQTKLSESTCQIEISDRGPGMSAEVLARAGEPFFTTKAPGKGMGLGLFLTRIVLEKLGGKLELLCEPNRGTRAVVSIPRLDATRG